jgi:hypothetical protein
MVKAVIMRAKIITVLGVALGVAPLGAGCSLEQGAPDTPTYQADVRPIFMARCVRCHGDPPMGDPTSTNPTYQVAPTSPAFRLDMYDDATNCAAGTTLGTADCPEGAKSLASLIKSYVGLPQATRMPPDPAPALTGYQLNTVNNWASEPTPLEM